MKFVRWMFALAVAAWLTGCASLQPGADPLVVRAEQVQKVTLASFDAFLRFDDAQREWMRANAPEAHAFAEWLRADTGAGPRGIAILDSLQAVKSAYKKARDQSSKDALVTYLATVESALQETQRHLLTAAKGKQ